MYTEDEKMKVYVVRHGESEGNAQKRHSGWGPFDLTERGREQAEATGKVIRDLPFDRIFVSDLVRTQQTAAIALPERIAEFELRANIREYNTGRIVGRKFEDLAAEYGAKYTDCRVTGDFTPMGGEDPDHFVARVGEFMQELEGIAAQNEEGKPLNVAVFAHAGVMRCMGEYVLGVPYRKNMWANENCSINVFEYKNGKWRALLWNYAPALNALKPEG